MFIYSNNNLPCLPGDVHRYAAYLDDLGRGHDLGKEAFHSWPQVLKMDVLEAMVRGLQVQG